MNVPVKELVAGWDEAAGDELPVVKRGEGPYPWITRAVQSDVVHLHEVVHPDRVHQWHHAVEGRTGPRNKPDRRHALHVGVGVTFGREKNGGGIQQGEIEVTLHAKQFLTVLNSLDGRPTVNIEDELSLVVRVVVVVVNDWEDDVGGPDGIPEIVGVGAGEHPEAGPRDRRLGQVHPALVVAVQVLGVARIADLPPVSNAFGGDYYD